MLQRRTRAPFPAGAILIALLLLGVIVYYWITNKPAPSSTVPEPATELPDTSVQDTL